MRISCQCRPLQNDQIDATASELQMCIEKIVGEEGGDESEDVEVSPNCITPNVRAAALALLPLNFASETPRDDIFIRVLSRTCDTKTGISKCTIKLSRTSLLENETSSLSLSLFLSLSLCRVVISFRT